MFLSGFEFTMGASASILRLVVGWYTWGIYDYFRDLLLWRSIDRKARAAKASGRVAKPSV